MSATGPRRATVDIDAAGASTAHPGARRIPGEPGIWVFIFGDLLMFSAFFMVLLHFRGEEPGVFATSQARLNEGFGLANTLLMLVSSWCVACAVYSARRGAGALPTRLLMAAVACGAGFVVIKLLEYGQKFAAGITPMSNDFYLYYFAFTGIHFAHVLLGMAVLTLVAGHLRAGPYDAGRALALECGASFWHVVDLLWIVLFALFYLLK